MDNQLPAETLEEIKLSADAFAAGMYPNFPNERDRAAKIFSAGATEYATRLLQVEQENKALRGDIEVRDWDIKQYNKKAKALQAKCDKYENALNKIANTSYDTGREGCAWGDTNYDSMSAVAGYNQCVHNVVSVANKALSEGEGKEGGNEKY